jgi:peptidyl-prolyl cis-trans isomerase C
VLILGFLIGACAGDRKASPELAIVNGKPVTQSELDAFLKLKRIPATEPARLEKVLDEYLKREAVASAIEKSGKLDATLIAAEQNEFRKELVISRYFQELLDAKVTDQAVQSYYDTHAAEHEERKVRVAHILFRTHQSITPEERQAKLTAARDAHSKIASGMDFAAVAKAMSEDRVSGENGGDLGWVGEGGIDPQFSAKVFAMKADEVSEPFESSFGYHVVKVLDAPQTVRKPFAAVQGDIRHKLRAEAKSAEMERLLAAAKIERKAAPKPSAPAKAAAGEKARSSHAP